MAEKIFSMDYKNRAKKYDVSTGRLMSTIDDVVKRCLPMNIVFVENGVVLNVNSSRVLILISEFIACSKMFIVRMI